MNSMRFTRTFWVANSIELFERWAWYGFFMLFATYLTGSANTGGLELSQSQKGIIMGIGTGILYFLPSVTGAISDRFGYKRVLFISCCIYASAFLLMPMAHSFAGVFAVYLYLAIGGALFKPIVSATIAKITNEGNASIGFGIYYMVVNVGAFIGPLVSLFFKDLGNGIFYISAIIISLNFALLIFYKEPKGGQKASKDASLWHSTKAILKNLSMVLKDRQFLIFLLIISAFWASYNQLYYTLPVFIYQWVDTSALFNFFAQHIPFVNEYYSPEPGVMDAEFITNIDALYIIIFQVVVSSIVMKLKPLRAMTSGVIISTIGMALTLSTQNVIYIILALFIFGVGEMSCSPKITEYISRIAPADKKALYIGYSFIPNFIGNLIAGIIGGGVYQHFGDKVALAHRYAEEQGVDIPANLGQSEYLTALAEAKGMNVHELTHTLWDTYHPSNMGLIILAIGLTAAMALYIYDKAITQKSSSKH